MVVFLRVLVITLRGKVDRVSVPGGRQRFRLRWRAGRRRNAPRNGHVWLTGTGSDCAWHTDAYLNAPEPMHSKPIEYVTHRGFFRWHRQLLRNLFQREFRSARLTHRCRHMCMAQIGSCPEVGHAPLCNAGGRRGVGRPVVDTLVGVLRHGQYRGDAVERWSHKGDAAEECRRAGGVEGAGSPYALLSTILHASLCVVSTVVIVINQV